MKALYLVLSVLTLFAHGTFADIPQNATCGFGADSCFATNSQSVLVGQLAGAAANLSSSVAVGPMAGYGARGSRNVFIGPGEGNGTNLTHATSINGGQIFIDGGHGVFWIAPNPDATAINKPIIGDNLGNLYFNTFGNGCIYFDGVPVNASNIIQSAFGVLTNKIHTVERGSYDVPIVVNSDAFPIISAFDYGSGNAANRTWGIMLNNVHFGRPDFWHMDDYNVTEITNKWPSKPGELATLADVGAIGCIANGDQVAFTFSLDSDGVLGVYTNGTYAGSIQMTRPQN